jgi:type I restriction enzyme S subunit
MKRTTVELGEVCDFLSGFAFKSELFSTEPIGLPIIRIRDVLSGSSATFYCGDHQPQYIVQKGDILIGMDGEFNRERWKSDPALLNQRVCKAIARESLVDNGYLYHALPMLLKKIEDETPFVTVKHLSVAKLKSAQIPLHPLEEQRRIAAILDKVALLIQSAAQAFCLSQELKKSLVHETLRLAREGDERVRIKVREVADMITGFPFKSAQYTDKAQHTRLCRGINVLPERIEWKQVARWPEITPELRSYQIDEDDILIAMDRPWIADGFKIARVQPTDIPSLLVQRVARIRAGNRILPRILFEVLSSKAFATHCTPTETTVPHISPIEIREYEFDLPCMKEQKRIDSILAGIEKSQAAMNQRVNLLKEKLCTLSRSYFN